MDFDLERDGNLVEAGIWFLCALALAWKLRGAGPLRGIYGTLCAGFLVFSVSDLIESRTGAWWRPWWLLVMKAACAAVFLFGFRAYYRVRRGPRGG